MGYVEAKTAIDAANLSDDAARLAYATETVYATRPAKVTFFVLRAETSPGVPFFAKAKVDALAAILQQADPIGYAIMLGEGVEVSHPDAQALLAALPTLSGGAITVEDCDKIRDLGRVLRGQRFAADWGLQAFDADALRRLPLLAAWEGMSREWDQWNGILAMATAVGAAMLGVSVEVAATRRDAATAAVQAWKVKIDQDQDATGMPATALELWGATA